MPGLLTPFVRFPRFVIALRLSANCLRLEAKEGGAAEVLGALAAVSDQDPLFCPRDFSYWVALWTPLKSSPLAPAPLPCSSWPRQAFLLLSFPSASSPLNFLQHRPSPQSLPFSFGASRMNLLHLFALPGGQTCPDTPWRSA